MKKITTIIFSVVACLAFTLGLSACDKENSNEPTHTHSFTNYVSNDDGTETAVCDFDGCQATDTKTISNTQFTPTEGIVYKLLESGDGYEVTGYTGTDTQVYIPATYENLPVTSIGEGAFFRRTNLTEVVIPDSVTTIGARAFAECWRLTEIVVPDSIMSISEEAFYGCSSLTEIIIGDSVTTIGAFAFYGCSSLTIYCEAESKPDGWDDNWNYHDDCPVVWGYTGE